MALNIWKLHGCFSFEILWGFFFLFKNRIISYILNFNISKNLKYPIWYKTFDNNNFIFRVDYMSGYATEHLVSSIRLHDHDQTFWNMHELNSNITSSKQIKRVQIEIYCFPLQANILWITINTFFLLNMTVILNVWEIYQLNWQQWTFAKT